MKIYIDGAPGVGKSSLAKRYINKKKAFKLLLNPSYNSGYINKRNI